MEGVAVHKSVVVGKAGNRDLLGDLYVPTVTAELRPAIVVVHGGGWRKGRPESVRGFGELLGQAGFVCLLASYRLLMEASWPAQIEDVKCAIRFLRASADSLGWIPTGSASSATPPAAILRSWLRCLPPSKETGDTRNTRVASPR